MSDLEFYKARDEKSSYRCKGIDKHSSSESSDDGEEDTSLCREKQKKFFRKQNSSGVVSDSSSPMKEGKTDSGYAQGSQRKKSNNIWGSVITEQDLTQTLVQSAAVDKPDELSYNERSVESYDFTKKYQEKRHGWDMTDSGVPSLDNNTDNFNFGVNSMSSDVRGRTIIGYEDTLDKSRDQRDLRHNIGKSNKRKRKADNGNDRHQHSRIHDRLGIKKVTTTKLGEIDVSVDMESELLIAKIAEFLHEPKVELIERIVTHLGKDVAIRILEATKDVEEGGGMYTLDGSRRRTPGGVYLTLMKQQPEFNKDVRRLIFVEDVQEMMKHRREKRKKAKTKKKQQAKNEGKEQEDNNLGSVSHSESGSVSNSLKTTDKAVDVAEDMEDGEIKDEPDDEKNTVGKVNRQNSKNNSDDGSSGESDYYDNDRQKSVWSKPFNFEDELAETKKLILEKSKSQNKGQNCELKETECNEGQDMDINNVSEMADLESAEANVVDIDLGIDTD